MFFWEFYNSSGVCVCGHYKYLCVHVNFEMCINLLYINVSKADWILGSNMHMPIYSVEKVHRYNFWLDHNSFFFQQEYSFGIKKNSTTIEKKKEYKNIHELRKKIIYPTKKYFLSNKENDSNDDDENKRKAKIKTKTRKKNRVHFSIRTEAKPNVTKTIRYGTISKQLVRNFLCVIRCSLWSCTLNACVCGFFLFFNSIIYSPCSISVPLIRFHIL